jgi:ABC-type antimicrobial peptide transport system permease subunit
LTQTISGIEKIYDTRLNGVPFDFSFVDTDYEAMYKQEQSIASLSRYFAGVAILISCLGLLGLTAFTVEKRSKEIGIRKVLGAGSWRIIYLLSSQFTKMVLLSLLIGLPISYIIASNWMQNFAFGIELDLFSFALVGLLTIGIAWLAVGFQTLKASRTNPVESLRSE